MLVFAPDVASELTVQFSSRFKSAITYVASAVTPFVSRKGKLPHGVASAPVAESVYRASATNQRLMTYSPGRSLTLDT